MAGYLIDIGDDASEADTLREAVSFARRAVAPRHTRDRVVYRGGSMVTVSAAAVLREHDKKAVYAIWYDGRHRLHATTDARIARAVRDYLWLRTRTLPMPRGTSRGT